MKTFKKLKEPEYIELKRLLEIVATGKLIKAGITTRSPYTLGLIKKSKDFADYKAITKELLIKYKKPVTVATSKEVEGNRVKAQPDNFTNDMLLGILKGIVELNKKMDALIEIDSKIRIKVEGEENNKRVEFQNL